MTEPARTIARTKLRRTLFLLAVAGMAVLPQQARACHQPRFLLDNEPGEGTAGAPTRARLRVEEALFQKVGQPTDPIAYRMLVTESDGKLRAGDHIVVAAPGWGDHCIFWIGEPDAKGDVEGYATIPAKAAGQTYYWLSPPLSRSTGKLEIYKTHPDRFVWRRIRFKAWESAPSQ